MHSNSKAAVALMLVLLACGGSPPAPSNPPLSGPAAWDTAEPEAMGFDSTALAEAVRFARESDVGMHAIVLIRDGSMVLNACFYPYDCESVHDIASVTKSVTSTLAGIAIDRGLLRLDEPVLDRLSHRTLPGTLPDERRERMTLGHLLSMTSGMDCGRRGGEIELLGMLDSTDWVGFSLALPMADEPGTSFGYCSSGTHLAMAMLEDATGNAMGFAQEALFQPLGIRDVVWPVDPQGLIHGWGDLQLHPEDMARLGQLLLQHGTWSGGGVVSPEWLAHATTAATGLPSGESYGYGWWLPAGLRAGMIEARGRGGQHVIAWPALNIVVAFAGAGMEGPALEGVGMRLMAAVRGSALPENPEGRAELEAALLLARAEPTLEAVPAAPVRAGAVSGVAWAIDENAYGITELVLGAANSNEPRLEIVRQGERHVVAIGLDGRYRFSALGPTEERAGARGAWTDPDTFAIDYVEPAGVDRMMLRLDFGDRLEVVIEDPTDMLDGTLVGYPAD